MTTMATIRIAQKQGGLTTGSFPSIRRVPPDLALRGLPSRLRSGVGQEGTYLATLIEEES